MTHATRHLRPFFGYLGSKWGLAKTYAAPRYDTIVEPFAGSAGYSLRYADRKVILIERDPVVARVWRYLISANPERVLALPDVAPGQSVNDPALCLSEAEQALVGFWLHKQATKPRSTPGTWMAKHPKGGFWGPSARARIAEQLPAIRHWMLIEGSYKDAEDLTATWFVDPPYVLAGKAYVHSSRTIDYAALSDWCRARRGQAIVCEAEGADWLPFEPHGKIKTIGGKHAASEVVWYGGNTSTYARADIGSDEWIDRTVGWVKTQLRAVGADCRTVAEQVPALQDAAAARGIDWKLFCRERLETEPVLLDQIVRGVAALTARGHKGDITRDQAEAEVAEPIAANGAIGNGRSSPYIIRATHGTSAEYLAARIARDRPDILERMKRGEYGSVRKAAIDAGIVKIPSPVDRAMAIVRKMSPEDLTKFVAALSELRAERSPVAPLRKMG